jgi:transposase InsO family protein
VLTIQRKFGGKIGWFRVQGYLSSEYGIRLGEYTIKKIMNLNRRLHLAPQSPIKVEEPSEIREGPVQSKFPFENTFMDIRYLDAKPEGTQLYSCLLLEGFSRTILAGSLAREQDVGVVLYIYYLALLQRGRWQKLVTDHGSQFRSNDFDRVNRPLQIAHHMYEKGQPWRNLIEAQFGIPARLGEYMWNRCKTISAAEEIHRDLIRDHNRLPHFAHRLHNDETKRSPIGLGASRGEAIEPTVLDQAFSRKFCQRKTDARGFVRVGIWKIYVKEGLPRTSVQLIYWDGKLRAEYQEHKLAEYKCHWENTKLRPKFIGQPVLHANPFQSKQQFLFDPLWIRDPVERVGRIDEPLTQKQVASRGGKQMKLYLGPELIKR